MTNSKRYLHAFYSNSLLCVSPFYFQVIFNKIHIKPLPFCGCSHLKVTMFHFLNNKLHQEISEILVNSQLPILKNYFKNVLKAATETI